MLFSPIGFGNPRDDLSLVLFPSRVFCINPTGKSGSRNHSSARFGLRGMGRENKIQLLADALYAGFVHDDGGEWLSGTGNLVCAKNLRVLRTRKAFQTVRKAVDGVEEGRFWTQASLRDAIAKMMSDRGLQVPMTPGFTWEAWLKEQAASLHYLSQRARKNAWKMDSVQTVPWEPSTEDRVFSQSLPLANTRDLKQSFFPTAMETLIFWNHASWNHASVSRFCSNLNPLAAQDVCPMSADDSTNSKCGDSWFCNGLGPAVCRIRTSKKQTVTSLYLHTNIQIWISSFNI